MKLIFNQAINCRNVMMAILFLSDYGRQKMDWNGMEWNNNVEQEYYKI